MQPGKYALYLFMLLQPLPAAALTLGQAWFMALDKDPLYQAAVKDKLAGEEYIPMGRAGLLPKVSLSYQRTPFNWQRQQYRQSDLYGRQAEVIQHQQYGSYSGSLSLTLPLLDYEAYTRYRMGIMQTLQSDERYRSSLADLQNRLINAWLDLAEAQQKRQLTRLQRQTLQALRDLTQRQFETGEKAITDVAETRSALSIAEADEVDALDNLDAATITLSTIIGVDLPQTDAIPVLNDKPLRLPLTSPHYGWWEKRAIAHNPDILAARNNVEEKRLAIENSRAGAYPRLELFAARSENDSGNDNTVHQKYRTDSVGLRVSMNIYSGGVVSASTRQAAARFQQARYLQDAQRLKTFGEIKKLLNKCLRTPTRIQAFTQAVEAASRQVEATKKSILAGERLNTDLLNAEQVLFKTRVELSAEKYAAVKAWVGLLAQTGEINIENFTLLDAYFAQ